jgi:hypothetical protein
MVDPIYSLLRRRLERLVRGEIVDIFVPDYDWNSHWSSVDESAGECDYAEGEEFKMVRLTVGACITYRIVNGQPVPVLVAFPDAATANVCAKGLVKSGRSPLLTSPA